MGSKFVIAMIKFARSMAASQVARKVKQLDKQYYKKVEIQNKTSESIARTKQDFNDTVKRAEKFAQQETEHVELKAVSDTGICNKKMDAIGKEHNELLKALYPLAE